MLFGAPQPSYRASGIEDAEIRRNKSMNEDTEMFLQGCLYVIIGTFSVGSLEKGFTGSVVIDFYPSLLSIFGLFLLPMGLLMTVPGLLYVCYNAIRKSTGGKKREGWKSDMG